MDKYGMNAENVPAHEWIGETVTVKTTDGAPKSFSGTIVWETQNTIDLETGKGIKKIPKKVATIVFTIDGKKIELNAKDWIARPEDRIKKWKRKNA